MRARPRRTARIAEDCVRGSGGCTHGVARRPACVGRAAPCRPNSRRSPEPGARCFMESWPRARRGVEYRGRGDGRGGARPTGRRRLRDRFCGLSSASAGASGPGTSRRCAARNGSCRAVVEQSRGRDCDCVGHRSHPLASRPVVARDTVRRQAGGAQNSSIATSSFHRLRRSSNTISISSGRCTA